MPPEPDVAEGAPSAGYPIRQYCSAGTEPPDQVASSAAGWRRHARPARQRLNASAAQTTALPARLITIGLTSLHDHA